MIGSYSPLLVALSMLVACVASYTALDLAGRVAAAAGRARVGWLVGGSFAMGVGIWSMHFTGMLAFRLRSAHAAVPMQYAMPQLLLSVAVAVVASAVALAVVGRRAASAGEFAAAGLVMGSAICGMHYIGMASLRVAAVVRYRPPLVLASIVIAVGASLAALWLAFRLRDDAGRAIAARRGLAAVAMGAAIAGMHYTAMAAAHFTPAPARAAAQVHPDAVLATNGLAALVVAGTLLVLALALLGATLDRWLRRRLQIAAEHERLYREAEGARQAAAVAHRELQEQAVELEQQMEEAQTLAEELEQTNEELHRAVAAAEDARDVAERSEHGFRQIFEGSPLPMWVYDGATLAFIDMNPAASSQYGWSRDEIGSLTLRDIRPADELAALDAALAARAARAAGAGPRTRMRSRHRTRDGTLLDVEVATQDAPFAGPGARLAIVVDVTERVRAQRHERFLAEASRALGASFDYHATLERVTQLAVPALADWCAIDLARVPGDPSTLEQVAAAHVDPTRVELAREFRRQYPPPNDSVGARAVVRTGRPEFYPRLGDDTLAVAAQNPELLRQIREVGLHSAVVVPLVAHDRVLGALTLVTAESRRRFGDADLALAEELGRRAGLAIDNARLHEAERAARAAAEAANVSKSQFLANMSHELRTPLNAIAGHVELVQMGLHGPVTDAQQDALARVKRAQEHLLGLITDILNYAQLEAGRVRYEIREVALAEVVHEVTALVAPLAAAKRLVYDVALPDETTRVRADAEKLRQVLLNLLSNAIKFTGPDGRVGVDVSGRDGTVFVRVSDTGVGIPPDKLETVFAPFTQVESGLTRATGGTGLGLAISRDLARGMGGDLRARSQTSVGSTFTLTLPSA